ncbi:hypothetical protein AST99_11125 [Formosa algae]|nr:hypothetical protein AST99_11125 [Formosa algae]
MLHSVLDFRFGLTPKELINTTEHQCKYNDAYSSSWEILTKIDAFNKRMFFFHENNQKTRNTT